MAVQRKHLTIKLNATSIAGNFVHKVKLQLQHLNNNNVNGPRVSIILTINGSLISNHIKLFLCQKEQGGGRDSPVGSVARKSVAVNNFRMT